MYIYFNNPDQASDLSSSFTSTGPKAGTIALNGPSSNSVGDLTQQRGNNSPVASFQKTVNEDFYVWFRVRSLMARRITAYNEHLDNEEVDYIKIESLDSAGVNDTNRYTEGETRIIPGWVGVKIKQGADNTDYTLCCNIVTSGTALEQTYSPRALIMVRNLLPS